MRRTAVAAVVLAVLAAGACTVAAAPQGKLAAKLANKMKPLPKPSRSPGGLGPNGILVFTRFNCAFPFCPTTSLDVCSAVRFASLSRLPKWACGSLMEAAVVAVDGIVWLASRCDVATCLPVCTVTCRDAGRAL